jgi:hypothetical protein
MSGAAYRVHRLIQDLNRDPHLVAAFRSNTEAVFDQYEILEAERALLRDGSPKALVELGVHPNLQMKFYRVRAAPTPAGPGPLEYYIRRLEGRR